MVQSKPQVQATTKNHTAPPKTKKAAPQINHLEFKASDFQFDQFTGENFQLPGSRDFDWERNLYVQMKNQSWNDAEQLLSYMPHKKVCTEFLLQLIGLCLLTHNLQFGIKLHKMWKSLPHPPKHIALYRKFVQMYVGCKDLKSAATLIQNLEKAEIPVPPEIYGCMIGGYIMHREPQGMEMLNRIPLVEVGSQLLIPIFRACGNSRALDLGMEIHQRFIRSGLIPSTENLLLSIFDMYTKCECHSQVPLILQEIEQHGYSLLTEPVLRSLINSSLYSDQLDKAELYLEEFQKQGHFFNAIAYSTLLKACTKAASLDFGMKLWKFWRKSNQDLDHPQIHNAFLIFFLDLGRFDDAKRLFEKMIKKGPSPNRITWITFLQENANRGAFSEVFRLMDLMVDAGFQPSDRTFYTLLMKCSTFRNLAAALEVHRRIRESGIEFVHTKLNSAIRHMYLRCGVHERSSDWIEFQFQPEKHPDLVLGPLNSPLPSSDSSSSSSTTKSESYFEQPNSKSSQLNSMNAAKISENPLRNSVEWNRSVQILVDEGKLDEAGNLFREGLERFAKQQKHFSSKTFISLITQCGKTQNLPFGQELHEIWKQNAHQSELNNPRVLTSLLNMYRKCGAISEAQALFDQLGDNQDVFGFTTMMTMYISIGKSSEARNLLNKMHHKGLFPDVYMYVTLANQCETNRALDLGLELYQDWVESGRWKDQETLYEAFLSLFAACGSSENVTLVLTEMRSRGARLTASVWQILISARLESGDLGFALDGFREMHSKGLSLGGKGLYKLISAVQESRSLENAQVVLQHWPPANKLDASAEMEAFELLLETFLQCGSLQDASAVLRESCMRRVALRGSAWIPLITEVIRSGDVSGARSLFLKLVQNTGVSAPSLDKCVDLINACAKFHQLDLGNEVYQYCLQLNPENANHPSLSASYQDLVSSIETH